MLWFVLGAGLLVWAGLVTWSAADVPDLLPLSGIPAGATALALAVAGAAVTALAAALLHGWEAARVAVTVLGAVTAVAGLPLALVVPAVVLQLHPSVGPWLADAARRRAQLTH